MDEKIIMSIILGVLVIVSGVQAIQLTSIKSDISEQKLSVSTASASANTGSSAGRSTVALPSSIKELPQMVGGC